MTKLWAEHFCPEGSTTKLSFNLKKFLPIFQNINNLVSKAMLGKCQKCSKHFQCKMCNSHLRHCGKKVQFTKDFRTDGDQISNICVKF